MLEALKQNQHFSVTEDIIMHLHQIPGGYMVWQTDLSQINQALRELQRLNAELEEEQDLLAQEIRIQSDEASIQARNDIYDSLSSEVAGQLALLTELLSKESLSIGRLEPHLPHRHLHQTILQPAAYLSGTTDDSDG